MVNAPGSAAAQNQKRLTIVFALTSTYLVAEAFGGWLTGSLALLADAGHMLTDAGGLGLALLAIYFGGRAATLEKSYGYLRLEVLAALANAVILLLITVFILLEAWRRFQAPPEVTSWPMILVATVGLAVNIISALLLHGASAESLNVKGAYFEVLSDVLGSLGAIAAGGIMLTTGWYLADPLIGGAIGLFIIPRTLILLRGVANILLEGTPAHINPTLVEAAIREVATVVEVHDLHIWTITSGVESLTVHVTVLPSTDRDRVREALRGMLKTRFNISHTTIEVEGEALHQRQQF